jgi:hypothetical protein
MDRLTFLVDWYNKEHDRQGSLTDSLNIPIGILTAIIAVIFYLLNQFTFGSSENYYIQVLFVVFIAAAILSWLFVVFHLFKSYNNLFAGYKYGALPLPTDLELQYKKYEKYVQDYKASLSNSITADSLYEAELIKSLTTAVTINISNNDLKAARLYNSKKHLFICLIFVIFSLIPFVFNYIHSNKSHSAQEVIIKNFDDLKK